jgi:hypothetical protein
MCGDGLGRRLQISVSGDLSVDQRPGATERFERRRKDAALLKTNCANYAMHDGSMSVSMRSPFNAFQAVQTGGWLGVLDEYRTAVLAVYVSLGNRCGSAAEVQ